MRKIFLIATGLAAMLPVMPASAGGQTYYGYSQPNYDYYNQQNQTYYGQRDNDAYDQDDYDRSANNYDRYDRARDEYQAERDRYQAERNAWNQRRDNYYDRTYNDSYSGSYGSGYSSNRYAYTGRTWWGRDGRMHCRKWDGTTGVIVGGGSGVPRYCR